MHACSQPLRVIYPMLARLMFFLFLSDILSFHQKPLRKYITVRQTLPPDAQPIRADIHNYIVRTLLVRKKKEEERRRLVA